MALVSRYGLIAFASSLDQIGPLTRDVYDNAMVLETICGQDKRDATSLPVSELKLTAGIEQRRKGYADCPAQGVFLAMR